MRPLPRAPKALVAIACIAGVAAVCWYLAHPWGSPAASAAAGARSAITARPAQKAADVPSGVALSSGSGQRGATSSVVSDKRQPREKPSKNPVKDGDGLQDGQDPSPEPETPPSDPVVPPKPPVAPGMVASVSCMSGDMVDVVTFEPSEGEVIGYELLRATTPSSEFSSVATSGPEARSFVLPVSECAVSYYRVIAYGPGGTGPLSETVSNDVVAVQAEVPPEGRTLRSSNGEVVLVLPAGAYDTTTSVTVDEISGSPVGGIITFAGIYSIQPSGSLGAPATLSISYKLAITHRQVTETLLHAAGLLTLDEVSGNWVSGASNVRAEAGYIVGEVDHFSPWTPGSPSPHGTGSDSMSYCSGVCHDLETYPGSSVRYATRDPQICFNCHGNTDIDLPPLCGTGSNVQAEFFAIPGEPAPDGSSSHPVTLGGLYCTACHDPHASSTNSPGLLRAWNPLTGAYIQGSGGIAPNTEFCWTCHGAMRNRRIDYLVPGYWLRAGGDKRTAFNGAHTGLGTAVWRYDTESELKQGYTGSTAVGADGTVAIAGNVLLPKTASSVSANPTPGYAQPGTDSPGPIYDGNAVTNAHWYAWNMGAAGATEAVPKVGTGTATIDLGSSTMVSSFVFTMYSNTGFTPGTWSTDTLQIQTSDDNVAWQTVSTLGTVGTRLPDTFTIDATDTCRYVRFVFSRLFYGQSHSIGFAEIDISGPPSGGTFEVWPDIARKATFSGGVLKWSATVPATTSFSASVRGSIDRGATWTAWTPVTNGGAITQIPAGASLENARLQVRGTFSGTGVSPSLDWLEVDLTRGAITGTTPQWSGESPSNVCLRCHTWHGSANSGLVPNEASVSCKNCHSTAYGGTYAGATQFETSVHAALSCARCHTGHGKSNGSGDTYAFLLKDERLDACLGCHPPVKDALEGKQGVASQWAKHDMYSAEQVATGSTMSCRRCHGTHYSSSGLVNPDATASAFTALRDDPTSIPTEEVVVYASKDTLLDSTAGQQSWNYGASTQYTLTPSTRALLYFDLSAIPVGATIQNATLILWGTSPVPSTYKGTYSIYPVTRAWNEGAGSGVANSAVVDGASWYEWRYGDNAGAGNVAAGDWAISGGDYAATPTVVGGINAVNVTTIVQSQRAGTNNGILLKPTDATTFIPFYTRESASAQYRPRLRIVYQTGPATSQVIDDIAFCTKCHDGSMPLGLSGQSLSAVAATYASGAHGGKKGLGPESTLFSSMGGDAGGGSLKYPYSYGMDPLPCMTCHDPHGSRLPYHLKEVINGQSIVPTYGYDWNYDLAPKGNQLGYMCAACHIFPSSHTGYQTSADNCSTGCHNHAGR